MFTELVIRLIIVIKIKWPWKLNSAGFYSYFLHSVIYLFMKFGFHKRAKITTIFIFHVLIKFAIFFSRKSRNRDVWRARVQAKRSC